MLTTPDDVDTLARTMWGEARGCGGDGMAHVGSVILNRVAHPGWWGHDIHSVCCAPWQFSCRNPGDPNHTKLLAVTTADPQFDDALGIAAKLISGDIEDATGGADSYYAKSMQYGPAWALSHGAVRTYDDGFHFFYRTRGVDLGIAAAPISVTSTKHGG